MIENFKRKRDTYVTMQWKTLLEVRKYKLNNPNESSKSVRDTSVTTQPKRTLKRPRNKIVH